jgi:hypothetical protein
MGEVLRRHAAAAEQLGHLHAQSCVTARATSVTARERAMGMMRVVAAPYM